MKYVWGLSDLIQKAKISAKDKLYAPLLNKMHTVPNFLIGFQLCSRKILLSKILTRDNTFEEWPTLRIY